MRRRIGRVFIELGTVLIILALSLFLYNKWEAKQAQDAAEEIALQIDEQIEESDSTPGLSDTSNGESDGEMPTIEIDGYDYIGTLTISRFGLELPVMSEWSYPGLKIAPGRYQGSVWTDDMIICGHNYERHFGNLKNLESGDEIIFTDVNGNVFTYQVEEVMILQPTDVEEMVSQESGEWDLTLFTCTIGGRTRVTVRCSRTD
ncbi:MAG: sortase [Clostridiales bacterium]|nr:sortase [Clostridiales bacterium]